VLWSDITANGYDPLCAITAKVCHAGLAGMETKELRMGGEACQEVSRALTFMLCDEIPLKNKATPHLLMPG
jgi:hypothetical protein